MANDGYRNQSSTISLVTKSRRTAKFNFHYTGTAKAGTPGRSTSRQSSGHRYGVAAKPEPFRIPERFTEQFSSRFQQVTTVNGDGPLIYLPVRRLDSNNSRVTRKPGSGIDLIQDVLVAGYDRDHFKGRPRLWMIRPEHHLRCQEYRLLHRTVGRQIDGSSILSKGRRHPDRVLPEDPKTLLPAVPIVAQAGHPPLLPTVRRERILWGDPATRVLARTSERIELVEQPRVKAGAEHQHAGVEQRGARKRVLDTTFFVVQDQIVTTGDFPA